MMHSSLLVSHIQKLAHVSRASNAVLSNKCGGIAWYLVRIGKFMEYDFRFDCRDVDVSSWNMILGLTVGTLTYLSSQKQTSGSVAIGTVDHEQPSGNVAVGRSENYPQSTSIRSIRIVPSRSGDGQTHLDNSSSVSPFGHLSPIQTVVHLMSSPISM